MELLDKLGIDWKLLIAQIINFFILAVILGKFVYKPVLKMMEKRSSAIAKGLHDAHESEKKLLEIEKMQYERLSQTKLEIGRLLESAKTEAEIMKKDILAAAQEQSDDLLRKTRAQIAEEKEKMIQDVKKEVSQFILLATQKLLQREFSAADQKRLADAVVQEMKSV